MALRAPRLRNQRQVRVTVPLIFIAASNAASLDSAQSDGYRIVCVVIVELGSRELLSRHTVQKRCRGKYIPIGTHLNGGCREILHRQAPRRVNRQAPVVHPPPLWVLVDTADAGEGGK